MQVRVECCGASGRLAGAAQLEVELPEGADVRALFAQLGARSAEFATLLESCACARGDALVHRATLLADGDQLALLPPVAGG